MALKIAISVILRDLKSKSGYFLGFFKQISDEHTYYFCIKGALPPGVGGSKLTEQTLNCDV